MWASPQPWVEQKLYGIFTSRHWDFSCGGGQAFLVCVLPLSSQPTMQGPFHRGQSLQVIQCLYSFLSFSQSNDWAPYMCQARDGKWATETDWSMLRWGFRLLCKPTAGSSILFRGQGRFHRKGCSTTNLQSLLDDLVGYMEREVGGESEVALGKTRTSQANSQPGCGGLLPEAV